MSEVDDITGIVSFLCTEDAKFITGSNITVAGGAYSGL